MEDLGVPQSSELQDALLRKYCAEAETLLAQAPDYDTAFRLKQALCERFQSECESSIVVAAAKVHLDNLLKTRWKRGWVTEG